MAEDAAEALIIFLFCFPRHFGGDFLLSNSAIKKQKTPEGVFCFLSRVFDDSRLTSDYNLDFTWVFEFAFDT